MINKEYGSDFHLCLDEKYINFDSDNVIATSNSFSLFFSGRSALYSILESGIRDQGWKKVYFPGYYCHEVIHFIKRLKIEIFYYEFNPFFDSANWNIDISDDDENVIINVSFFGIKKLDLNRFKNVTVIDDLTHDILGFRNSRSDYAFASLRKVLPVPCGGYAFSTTRKLARPQYHLDNVAVAHEKATAMYLKMEYLQGRFKEKYIFRSLATKSESKFEDHISGGRLPEIAFSILKPLNIERILEAKKQNLNLTLSLLKPNARVVYNMCTGDHNTLGLLINLRSAEEHEKLKMFLISKNIFPAVLWPNQFLERDIISEKTNLLVHVDYRYDEEDIRFIADTLNWFFIDE